MTQPTTNNPHALYSAIASETHATVGADIVIDPACRRVRVGGTGNLSVVYANGVTDVITAILDGESLDISVIKIVASGTTATKVTIFW